MVEYDPLVGSYVHLAHFSRPDVALHTLKKVASLVKPIMRTRGWKVGELAEFYPDDKNLLGLNVNRGEKICLRLRHASDKELFLTTDMVVDIMLHELCHIRHGPHNHHFYALLEELRDEWQGLVLKGYTGEGFLSQGRRLGGSHVPRHEQRRLATARAAEARRERPSAGRRLGGAPPRHDRDIRDTIARAIMQRNKITDTGCGSERLTERQIHDLADTATRNGFRTQAEEDEANEAAIAQALWELAQEAVNLADNTPATEPGAFHQGAEASASSKSQDIGARDFPGESSESLRRGWVCQACTLHNPARYLCCDGCGGERSNEVSRRLAGVEPPPASTRPPLPPRDKRPSQSAQRSAARPEVIDLTQSPPSSRSKQTLAPSPSASTNANSPAFWECSFCGSWMERQWWSCELCGTIKTVSR